MARCGSVFRAATACAIVSVQLSLLPALTSAATPEEVRRMTIPRDGRFCVNFNPFPTGTAPGGAQPPAAVVASMMDAVLSTGRVSCLLVFGTTGAAAAVPALARARGVQVIMIAFLDPPPFPNQEQITSAITLARTYPDVIPAVICGSEVRLRSDAPTAAPVISDCVTQLRAAGISQPIGHSATWPEWCDEEFPGQRYPNCRRWEPIGSLVDFIGVTAYAFWENQVGVRFPCIPAAGAAGFQVDRLREDIALYSDRPVFLTEFGWPGQPGPPWVDPQSVGGCSVVSEENKALVARETLRILEDAGLGGVLFQAFLAPYAGGIDQWFGFCDPSAPFSCAFPSDTGSSASDTHPRLVFGIVLLATLATLHTAMR